MKLNKFRCKGILLRLIEKISERKARFFKEIPAKWQSCLLSLATAWRVFGSRFLQRCYQLLCVTEILYEFFFFYFSETERFLREKGMPQIGSDAVTSQGVNMLRPGWILVFSHCA